MRLGVLTVLAGLLVLFVIDSFLYYTTPTPAGQDSVALQPAEDRIRLRGRMDEDMVRLAASMTQITITDTPGGTMAAMRFLQNKTVVIDGRCVSACVWLLVTSERACFTPRTQFYFHAWHVQRPLVPFLRSPQMRSLLEVSIRSQQRTAEYVAVLPAELRLVVARLPKISDLIPVSYEQFAAAYPAKKCDRL